MSLGFTHAVLPTPRAGAPPRAACPVMTMGSMTRRAFSLSIPLVLMAPAAARADTSALVTPYKDLPKGFTILRPNGWNEFESSPESYDIKWQDVIQPLEFVTVLTAPLDKGKTLAGIGSAAALGGKLAAARSGTLVAAEEKSIDGIPAYLFEIKRGSSHQLTLLTVNKNKLYSVNASSPEKRWSKREKLLRSVVNSFQPKL